MTTKPRKPVAQVNVRMCADVRHRLRMEAASKRMSQSAYVEMLIVQATAVKA